VDISHAAVMKRGEVSPVRWNRQSKGSAPRTLTVSCAERPRRTRPSETKQPTTLPRIQSPPHAAVVPGVRGPAAAVLPWAPPRTQPALAGPAGSPPGDGPGVVAPPPSYAGWSPLHPLPSPRRPRQAGAQSHHSRRLDSCLFPSQERPPPGKTGSPPPPGRPSRSDGSPRSSRVPPRLRQRHCSRQPSARTPS